VLFLPTEQREWYSRRTTNAITCVRFCNDAPKFGHNWQDMVSSILMYSEVAPVPTHAITSDSSLYCP